MFMVFFLEPVPALVWDGPSGQQYCRELASRGWVGSRLALRELHLALASGISFVARWR